MVPSGRNAENLRFFPNATPSAEALEILASLEIMPRCCFTTAEPKMEHLLPMGAVQCATVHHTGLPEPWRSDALEATARHLEEIRQLHCDPSGRNWADIGYHVAVDRMGRVWQLRDLRHQGAHVKNHNAHNIGIVALGNFDLQEPAVLQLDTLRRLLDFLMDAYQLPSIHTHRQLADMPTSCPGRHLQYAMDQYAVILKMRR
jgi:N-acetylmuramoyl-L-alanine amidase